MSDFLIRKTLSDTPNAIRQREDRRNGKHAEQQRAYFRQYRRKNSEAMKEYGRNYRRTHRKRLRGRMNELIHASIESYITELVRRTRLASRSRMKACALTRALVLDLFEVQQGYCAITGIKMTHIFGNPRNISIDRIDNARGYEDGNIQLVCMAANFAKQDFSNAQMLEFFDFARRAQCRRKTT